MRTEDIAPEIALLASDFLFWFSRFEYALIKNAHLWSHVVGSSAEPGWDDFVTEWQDRYIISEEVSVLLTISAETQLIAESDQLASKAGTVSGCKSGLADVVNLLKTIRNDLHHGADLGGAGWDDPKRTILLFSSGKAALGQLAQLASLEEDYTFYY